MASGKKGFMLYADQKGVFDLLSNEQAGQLIKHILSYVNDENPVCADKLVNIAFEPIKQTLKRDLKKREERAERSRDNGKLGGRPKKKTKKPSGLQGNPEYPRKPDSVSVRDSVSVSVRDKEINTSKEGQPTVVYGKEDVNFVIETIKKACSENKLLYSGKGDIERRACTRLLSKSFSNKIAEFGMTLEQLIFTVVEVSKKLKYNNTFATSAKSIYYNREEIINKGMHQAENQTIARPSGKPTGTFKV